MSSTNSPPPDTPNQLNGSSNSKPKSKKPGYWKKRKEALKRQKAEAAGAQGQAPAPAPAESANAEAEAPLLRVDGPLQAFFDQYLPSFVYNPRNAVHDELKRLSIVFRRNQDAEEFAHFTESDVREDFKKALVDQFNYRYGTDTEDLANWQAICATLKIEPIPDNLKDAKEAVFNRHVNLVDLTTAQEGIQVIKVFPTEVALSKYTKGPPGGPSRIFPRGHVLDGSILWMLLRRILHPPSEGSRRDENNRVVEPGSREQPKRNRFRNKRNGQKATITEVSE